jgi:hypothetical protein
VQDATVAGVKRHLMPAGTKLPRGVKLPTVPTETAAAGVATIGMVPQQTVHTRYGLPTTVPAVRVPTGDVAVLSKRLQFSLAQAVCDPVTQSQQWQAQLTCGNVPFTATKVSHGATVLLTAPEPAHLLQAIHAGLKQRPALLVCYSAGLSFPNCLTSLWQALKQQQRALSLRASKGWWLVIAQPGTRVQQWLR